MSNSRLGCTSIIVGVTPSDRPKRSPLSSSAGTRTMRGSYDSARDGTDLDGHWAHADSYDADSANSKVVRNKLVTRSRYEAGSNGFYSGIIRTHVNMVVGIGPTLRALTGSTAFNQAMERDWYAWTQAMQLRRKLWCMGHARTQDGESIGLLTTNPNINHRVQLDLVLIETEQCQTPFLP